MKRFTLLLLILVFSTSLRAEQYGLRLSPISLVEEVDSLEFDSPSKFSVGKLISPASPIFLGSLTLYVAHANRLDLQMSDYISSGHEKATFDDYLQYSPVVAMWGLNAFGTVEPYHKFRQQTTILALSAVTSIALVRSTKYIVARRRPDSGAHNSFPSGHTATAFLGAEILHQEYGHHSPWISVAGYSLAALTGYMRIYNKRHYVADVLAGAGVGMLSVKLAYWIAPRVNEWLWGSVTGYEESSLSASIVPYSFGDSVGVGLSLSF